MKPICQICKQPLPLTDIEISSCSDQYWNDKTRRFIDGDCWSDLNTIGVKRKSNLLNAISAGKPVDPDKVRKEAEQIRQLRERELHPGIV